MGFKNWKRISITKKQKTKQKNVNLYPSKISIAGLFNAKLNRSRMNRWCNGQRARLEYGSSWVRYLVIAASSSEEERAKDWLARNQENVSEWGDMSIRRLLFQ